MATENYDCSGAVEIDEEPRHHLVISNEFVRAFAVEIAPRDRTLCHHHPHDYLLYVASAASITSAARDEAPKRLNYEDGECELAAAGLTHVVENLGEKPFHNIVVELLPRSDALRRGAPPSATSGKPEITPILDEESGAVFRVRIEPGADVEISGPAVLASPYDDALMLKELADFDIPLDSFRKLIWVCAPRKVTIKNFGMAAGRAIVFQVGFRK
jgi:hypothetical protein